MRDADYPPPSSARPTGRGLIGRAGHLPATSIKGLVDGTYNRKCREAHARFKMLDKQQLGVENKAMRPGEPGAESAYCQECGDCVPVTREADGRAFCGRGHRFEMWKPRAEGKGA